MNKYYPHLLVLAAFTIWSSIGIILNKVTLTSLQILWAISLIAMVITFFIDYRSNKLKHFQLIKNDKFIWLLFFAQAFHAILIFKALTMIKIANAILIRDLSPLFVLIFAPILIKEKYSPKIYFSFVIAFAGLLLLLGGDGFTTESFFQTGAILAFAGAVFQALSTICMKKLSDKYSASFLTFWQMLAQVILVTPFIIYSHFDINITNIAGVIFIALTSSIIAYYLFLAGIKHLKSVQVVILGYMEPFLAAIWGALFLAQAVTFNMLIGGLLILFANYLIVKFEEKS